LIVWVLYIRIFSKVLIIGISSIYWNYYIIYFLSAIVEERLVVYTATFSRSSIAIIFLVLNPG
jgi:hypothetical protein